MVGDAGRRHAGVEFAVLDRPNPLGGRARGPVLKPAFASGVGQLEIARRPLIDPTDERHPVTGRFDVVFTDFSPANTVLKAERPVRLRLAPTTPPVGQ